MEKVESSEMGLESAGTTTEMICREMENDEFATEYLQLSACSDVSLLLFHARRDARLSIEELAERSGFTLRRINDMEMDMRGRAPLSAYIAALAACGLFVSPLRLLPFDEARREAEERLRRRSDST